MRSFLQSALMRAKSRAASAASSGMAHSTTLPTASILARNTASLLSVLTRSPAGLNIFDTAPTTRSTPAPSSLRFRSNPAGPDSYAHHAGCGSDFAHSATGAAL